MALDSTRIVQKHQSALNLANQSMHAAFDGWATVETNPTTNYLNAKSLEANTCSMKLRDEEKVPILVSKLTSTLADRVESLSISLHYRRATPSPTNLTTTNFSPSPCVTCISPPSLFLFDRLPPHKISQITPTSLCRLLWNMRSLESPLSEIY
jgi:hypothetical protein